RHAVVDEHGPDPAVGHRARGLADARPLRDPDRRPLRDAKDVAHERLRAPIMMGAVDEEKAHEERVKRAFDALHEGLGDRLSDSGKESVERLRAAAAERDAESVRAHLTALKQHDSWLYR